MRWTRLVLRNLRQRPSRAVVSIAAVAIGVTVFLSVSIATRDLRETIESAGDMGVDNGVSLRPTGVFDAYAPRAALEPIRALPGVVFAAGSIWTNAVVDVDGELLTMTLSAWGAPTEVATGTHPAPGADEIAIGTDVGLAVGDRTTVRTPAGGTREVVVTGIVGSGSGPSYALTSAATLQTWLGVGDVVNSVIVSLDDGVDPQRWMDDHRHELGPFQQTAGFYGSDAVEFFRAIDESIAPLAASSLFVAGYLIFLTLGRAVQDRRTTIATLRALGTGRRQLVGLIVGEALVVGIIGTAIGLGFGSVLSRGVSAALREIMGVELAGDGAAALPPTVLAVGVALGLLAPLVAAVVPAVLAARTDPASHLRGEVTAPTPTSSTRLIGGAAAFAAGTAGTVVVRGDLKPLTVLVALAGAAVALPTVGRPIGALLTRWWSLLRPGPGELASQEMARRPGRSAQTTALVTTILMVAVVVATISSSQRPAFTRAVNAHYGADLDVHGSTGVGLTDEQLAALRADPDVAAVSPSASGSVAVVERGGRSEPLRVIDLDTYFDVAGIPWADGTDERAAVDALRRGEVALALAVARRAGVDVGDTVTLQTLGGPVPFRVGGLFHGLGWGETVSVTVSTDVARAAFGLRNPPSARVDLRPGVDVHAWARAKEGFFVAPTEEIRSAIMRGSDGITNMAYVLLVVTVFVGILGLANTLAMDMLDRRREVGVLRALGLQRREVRSMVVAQALVLTVVAGVLAVVLGSLLGAAFVSDANLFDEAGRTRGTDSLTLPLSYEFPARSIPAILVAAVVVGVVAGLTPARIASRMEPTEALRLPTEA